MENKPKIVLEFDSIEVFKEHTDKIDLLDSFLLGLKELSRYDPATQIAIKRVLAIFKKHGVPMELANEN